MGREIVMVGVCTLAVIAIAWLMDHPNKHLATVIALIACGVMVLVAYLKNSTRVDRRPRRLIVKEKRTENKTDSGV